MMKFLLALLLCWPLFSDSNEKYVINIAESVASPQAKEEVIEVLTLLYGKIGIKPTFMVLPSERGLRLVNSGEMDAEAARVEFIGGKYEQLLQIPTPLMSFNVSYYCIEENRCRIFNEHTVFIIPKGSEVLVTFCKQNNMNCLRVNNDESGFKSLSSGVGDVFLAADWIARTVMCNSSVREFFARPEPRLATPVYHYVNAQHYALVSSLNVAMQALAKEGRLELTTLYGLNSYQACGAHIINVVDSAK